MNALSTDKALGILALKFHSWPGGSTSGSADAVELWPVDIEASMLNSWCRQWQISEWSPGIVLIATKTLQWHLVRPGAELIHPVISAKWYSNVKVKWVTQEQQWRSARTSLLVQAVKIMSCTSRVCKFWISSLWWGLWIARSPWISR